MDGEQKVRVVIADDHDDLRMMMRMLIDVDERFELVGEAHDGRAAIQTIMATMPDLVLVDLAMPNVDGIGVLDACRDYWPQIPVVAVLSGFNRALMGPVARDHGAVAYIEKGVTLGTRLLNQLWDIWCEHGKAELETAPALRSA